MKSLFPFLFPFPNDSTCGIYLTKKEINGLPATAMLTELPAACHFQTVLKEEVEKKALSC